MTGIGANITYGYDSGGRRIRKTVSGVSTYYLYAGMTLIAEVNASGQLLRSYTWGANGLINDYSPTAGARYYLFDAAGNTFGMVGGAGSLLGVAGYGAQLFSSLPATPFRWKGQAGQFTDSETGNVYCQRRYYSPKLGGGYRVTRLGLRGASTSTPTAVVTP